MAVLLGGVALLLAGCRNLNRAEALTGAWQSKVQFQSGPFAAVKDLEFLYAFNAGGTMTESSNYDAAPPVAPGYGVWRRIGVGKYEARYLFYWTKAPAAFEELAKGGGWSPGGHGVLTERITITGDGNRFESTLRLEMFDSQGKPADGGGEATGRGSRIQL